MCSAGMTTILCSFQAIEKVGKTTVMNTVGHLLDAHQTVFAHILRYAKAHRNKLVVLSKGKVAKEGEH